MKKQIIGFAGSALVVALVVGCQSRPERVDQEMAAEASASSNVQAAAAMDASVVTEISFDKGSNSLTDSARQSITDTVNQARQSGREIKEIKVISWADQEYPAQESKKLSATQVNLAEQRARNVENFLEDSLSIGDVDSYNMAKRPGAMAELFNTEDTRLKHALENAGIPRANEKNKVTGKASRALVMVILEEN